MKTRKVEIKNYVPLRRKPTAGELLLFPITMFFVGMIVAAIRGAASSRVLILSGLVLDIVGAIGLALPDLILRRHITTPDSLIESRRQLFEVGHLIRDETDDERMNAIVDVIRKYWAGELSKNPYQIAIRKVHPGYPDQAVIVVYEEDGDGPVEWAKRHHNLQQIMNMGKSEYRKMLSSVEDFDFVGQQTPVYQWIGNGIRDIQQRLRWYRTEATITLAYGFFLMLLSYFINNGG